jgi:hypothetical protein
MRAPPFPLVPLFPARDAQRPVGSRTTSAIAPMMKSVFMRRSAVLPITPCQAKTRWR